MKELNDDLQAVMGKDRCQEDWWNDLKNRKSSETSVDASWVPVRETNAMDKVKACTKWGAVFGGISSLLFYWQQAGLLASSAAVPSLIICALGAGLTIGWHARYVYGAKERAHQRSAGSHEEKQADTFDLGSGQGSEIQHDREASDHRRVPGDR